MSSKHSKIPFVAFSKKISVAALALSLPATSTILAQDLQPAASCTPSTEQPITDNISSEPIYLNCSMTLQKGVTIKRPIILESSSASNVVLDCNGSTLDVSAVSKPSEKIAIVIRSKEKLPGQWDVPKHITVKNCNIKGLIRVYGLDKNANGPNMRTSSLRPTHTDFAQASAPQHVTFLNLTINATGGSALYIGPGVTWTTLQSSNLTGYSNGTAIYLDAESAYNSVIGNSFTFKTKSRELIAIDGSAHNRIVDNTFNDPINGGIFLYRNCGEGGVIRHQTPEFNTISHNTFIYTDDAQLAKPAIWLGSRQGKQKFCFTDPLHPFGSSLSSLDFARNNNIIGNYLANGVPELIRNSDIENVIQNNKTDQPITER
ncbi:right-handed parallel beta-helix repeat-containing protein [Agrobacterium sp. NPDC089420]|uniref:right-handed parallel beta-helix repeat-containing protein n=1 Tax=Agrobacterium sp. NPDC089420 TaxID=3363918 RepID=UPI003850CDE9